MAQMPNERYPTDTVQFGRYGPALQSSLVYGRNIQRQTAGSRQINQTNQNQLDLQYCTASGRIRSECDRRRTESDCTRSQAKSTRDKRIPMPVQSSLDQGCETELVEIPSFLFAEAEAEADAEAEAVARLVVEGASDFCTVALAVVPGLNGT